MIYSSLLCRAEEDVHCCPVPDLSHPPLPAHTTKLKWLSDQEIWGAHPFCVSQGFWESQQCQAAVLQCTKRGKPLSLSTHCSCLLCTSHVHRKKKKDHLLKKPAEAKPDNSYLYAYSDKICTRFWYTLVANTKERILGSTQEFPSQARLCSSGTADVLLFNMRKCRILFVFLLEII